MHSYCLLDVSDYTNKPESRQLRTLLKGKYTTSYLIYEGRRSSLTKELNTIATKVEWEVTGKMLMFNNFAANLSINLYLHHSLPLIFLFNLLTCKLNFYNNLKFSCMNSYSNPSLHYMLSSLENIVWLSFSWINRNRVKSTCTWVFKSRFLK